MKKLLITVAIIWTAATAARAGMVPPDSTIFPGLTGKQLVDSLVSAYKSTTNLGYDAGRDTMYGVIDKINDSLECVYSSYKIYMQPGQDPSTWAYDHGFNCEHTWPQSMIYSSTAVADLHHLYPTDIEVNGARDNDPFSDIPDAQTVTWYYNNTTTSSIPSSNIDLYAEDAPGTFEPREAQKGNTARSMYYMLTMWQLADTNLAWWTGQKNTLYAWHVNDPADAREIARTRKISTYQQGKANPYVLDSTLIRRAFFSTTSANTTLNFASTSIVKNEGDGMAVLTVNIANPSGSVATTVDVVLAGGTGTAADIGDYVTKTLTFPAGSSASRSDTVTITDDAIEEGTETLVFRLRNIAGGSSAAAGSDSVLTLTLTDNDDATAPIITSGPAATGITSSGATITWTTSEMANSWVYYGLTTAYSDTFRNETDVTAHSIGLSDLLPSTTYHYKVSSTDPLDNGPTYSGDNAFTTAAAGGFTVIVSEVNEQRSSLPLYYNEYIELYNNTGAPISLNGWQLKQDNTSYVTSFGLADTIKANGYFVVVRSSAGNWSNFYSIPYNVVGNMVLNGSETFSLRDAGNNLIDSTITFASSYYCQYRTRPFASGILPSSWYGDAANGNTTTYGTPGGANPNDPLGVELAYLSAIGEPGQISLKWTTSSETNSWQWRVFSSSDSASGYRHRASLSTAGTTNEIHHYGWADLEASAGTEYFYRLVEMDLAGDSTVYGPVSAAALPVAGRGSSGWVSISPNPFRQTISVSCQLVQPGNVRMDLYNVFGQKVRSLSHWCGVGLNSLVWDGKNAVGQKCPAGIYILRLEAGDRVHNGKIILIK